MFPSPSTLRGGEGLLEPSRGTSCIKKRYPPRTTIGPSTHSPDVGSEGAAFSYERGTSVRPRPLSPHGSILAVVFTNLRNFALPLLPQDAVASNVELGASNVDPPPLPPGLQGGQVSGGHPLVRGGRPAGFNPTPYTLNSTP